MVHTPMRSVVLMWLVLVLAITLSGCVASEVSDPRIDLMVTGAERVPGPCIGFGDEAEDCHVLMVHVVNGNEEEDVSNNMFYYEARASDGGVYSAPDVEGPDAFAPGAEGDIQLSFDLPSGEVRVVEVRYEAMWMSEPVVAPVPAY